jgi:O-methyltransferase
MLPNDRAFVRAMVKTTDSILPPKLFSALYRAAFPVYKRLLQLRYGLRTLFGRYDSGERTMRWRVYNAMPYSLVGSQGLDASYDICRQLNLEQRHGCFVELGVAQGGCALLIGQLAAEAKRLIWLFDSFEGLPDPSALDLVGGKTGDHVRPLSKGSCLGQLEEVRALLFERFHLSESQVRFVKGWFQDTLPVWKDTVGPIAMLRIDGDWYDSTKCCLEHLYDQVVDNGAIVIDDYGTCHGCKRAVDEFLGLRQLKVVLSHDGRGGVLFRKPELS